jgi:osmotically-inducible protein OsmY
MKHDEEIQAAVERELAWDPRVEHSHVHVHVFDGAVTLTGTVSSAVRQRAASDAARRVEGVRDVINHIAVCLPGQLVRSDAAILAAVRQALEWNTAILGQRINAQVANGWVTLAGEVEYWYQREEIERAVSHLAGVNGVHNQIVVRGPEQEASAVREEITAALERRAVRAARHVEISVHQGTVTLTGPVRTWQDKEALLGAARHTPGVRAVVDRLGIDPAS